MEQYIRGELVFDVIDAGPIDGPVVILLHGFPPTEHQLGRSDPETHRSGLPLLVPN